MKAYRIADPEFAKTPDEMLSGHGAYLFPGRWNSKGHPMVYLGESIGQASMEILVHAENAALLDQYVVLEVEIPPECVLRVPVDTLPDGWDDEDAVNPPSQQAGDQWLASMSSVALKVPSVAVPGGSNILINPSHPDMVKLVVGEIEEYRMDDRIKRTFE